ncbi:M [avian paramyxovirus 10]|uniref:Matrix protein n=2 Tax=Metaavulavirus falklandense TaxID=2560309 RepID=D9IL75_9MONO|nr:M [Avian paramyxovirus penguin/Falkland Islands/324/2007] [avian paramyxovirus 10]ADK12970.1 M [Avian paramyxovirus penguin/Falkland Islands/324/2007] [avian paramyxovirus 10]AQQ11603.1 M [Metaavulavirus falklandense] [Metaavulavirus falklandense]AQQ11608.1 M [Metaavulavirus falklandense] [Metaavulavirus falklandense]AQQ11613.1 M [Metaavulavirus falklandense] [Metaavulavirus falklandense]
MASTSIKLYTDPSAKDLELLSFPLIFRQQDDGTRQLQPQVRYDHIGDSRGGKESSIFLTVYGFIIANPGRNMRTGFETVNEATKPDCITAGLVVLGAVRQDNVPEKIVEDVFALDISIKKSATSHEKMTVIIHNCPFSLQRVITVRSGGFITSAEDCIKCPSKLQAGVNYGFKPMFLSFTYLNHGKVFRVPRAMYAIQSNLLFKVQLEIEFRLQINADHPQAKMLKKVETNGETIFCGYAWFHLCNFKKTNAKGEARTLVNLQEKVRAMGIKVSLHDLWGPTVIAQITGKSSKYAQGFFSSSGTSCLPVSKSSPELAKLMWSCSTCISEATIIIQAGEKRELLRSEDLEVKGAVEVNKKSIPHLNPFRK